MNVDAEFAVHFHVRSCSRLILLAEQQQPARLLEPRITANCVRKVVKDLAGFLRHLDQRRVQVVFTHHCAGTSGGATSQVSPLDQLDFPRSHAGQVHGDARPVDAAADDDHIR